MPIITLTGPRQSGKTTLVKKLFPNHGYANLESAEVRAFAETDPKGFLSQFSEGIILDEVQRIPNLLSYVQVVSDENPRPGFFILSVSQNFALLESISQSLAGRTSIFNLLPLSLSELRDFGTIYERYENYVFKGFYPRLYDLDLHPQELLPDYIDSYLERDVRQLINVKNLGSFQFFLRLCAGRNGQLLNKNSLAAEIGVDNKTINSWLGILEASYIIFRLHPYHKNYKKRLIKTPKLYFYDTGLACALLDIRSEDQLNSHYLKGELFEAFIISELMKERINQGNRPRLYFWRDKTGHEVDCLIEEGTLLKYIEIKSGRTLNTSFFKNLTFFQKLSEASPENAYLIYGGKEVQYRKQAQIVGWESLALLS